MELQGYRYLWLSHISPKLDLFGTNNIFETLAFLFFSLFTARDMEQGLTLYLA